MIGPDLVRARRRGDTLCLQELKASERQRARELTAELLELARSQVGEALEEVEQVLSAVDRDAREEKLFAGLRKLVLDECVFGTPIAGDAAAVRRDLFVLAAAMRADLEPGERLDRALVLEQSANALGVTAAALEQGMFSDLKGAQQLLEVREVTAEELVSRYQIAQVQGILLRASSVTLRVRASTPEAYRALFFKLKFRQLLHRIVRDESGCYQIEIDGPFSLFDATTKYGQKLSLLVPVLAELEDCQLSAKLRWGKERRNLTFAHAFRGPGDTEPPSIPGEVEQLIAAINRGKTGHSARRSSEILNLPGVGVLVPDLTVTDQQGRRVLVEVLGFWSRDAVWRRVEWAEARLAQTRSAGERLLFAVSSRLRVSAEVLPSEASAALYIYKGKMNPKALCQRAAELLAATEQ